jgi:GNS1/SUR4 family
MNGTGLAPAFLAGAIGQVAELSSTVQFMAPISMLQLTSPWRLLDKAWMAMFGTHAEDFRFTPGETPLATLKETTAMLVLYYTIILTGRGWMRNRRAYKLNILFLIHNFYLTAISGGLLVLFLEQLLPRLWSHGIYDNICGAGGWTDKLVVLYYLNYLTKYLEFFDTCFLFLKKKPLSELTYLYCVTSKAKLISSLPPHISPWRNGRSLFLSASWPHFGVMGSHHPELVRSCGHVLVLLPGCSWHQDLVERMDHTPSDHPVRPRPRLRLLRVLQLLQQHLFP